jgi:GNAT superfamily N-acetyltransferase
MLLHLAQLNVATLRRPLDHADTADFVDGLVTVNALAEASPGYVWRLQTDEGNATAITTYPDPLTIVNLTVWESLEALRGFAFRGLHRDFLRRRSEWFLPEASGAAMWWVPAGTLPTVLQAKRRLEFLQQFGPSAYAFGNGQQHHSLVVIRRPLDHPDVPPMIEQLNHELVTSEPDGGICFITLDPDEVDRDNGAFFVAYLDGVPRACGAYRRIGPTTAEVKRMWADPTVRGARLGAAMLHTIETTAIESDLTELKLETGEHLTAAVGLYEKFGFQPCEPWGDYRDSPLSHCMSKQLPGRT